MKPVKQSKLYMPDGIHNGNCFAACLASLLDLPLWMIPPFEDMFARGSWRKRCDEWLIQFYGQIMVRTDGHDLKDKPEFYIANGPSARGVDHSVIYSNGILVHDPHYSNEGIKTVGWCYHLVKL